MAGQIARKRARLHAVFSDIHIPCEDRRKLALVLDWVREYRPHTIHLLGDILDFYQPARYIKNPRRLAGLQSDLDKGVAFLSTLRRRAPRARIIYSDGNHEDRLRRYLWEHPEIHGLRCLDLTELLSLRKLDIEHNEYNHHYRIGHLRYYHGKLLRKHSAYSAKANYESCKTNIIVGHTHRLGIYHHRSWSEHCVAAENGCLCSLNQEYVDNVPNWQHGFSLVWYRGPRFHLTQISIPGPWFVDQTGAIFS